MVSADGQELAAQLRYRLRRLLSERKTGWTKPIVEGLCKLRDSSSELWILGGTPRDLVAFPSPRRPRDVDLVSETEDLHSIVETLGADVKRETRFGGLQLSLDQWPVDVWPLSRTWAFREGIVSGGSFEDLPRTTFLNIEAIAIELTNKGGSRPRGVVEEGFGEAIARRLLDINLEANPFPALCVVRTLVFATMFEYEISARLVQYLAHYMNLCDVDELVAIQYGHYGRIRLSEGDLRKWRQWIGDHARWRPLLPLRVFERCRAQRMFPGIEAD